MMKSSIRQAMEEGIRAAPKRRFDLNGTIELLLNQRKETFPSERAIRLFQFQTWILYPDWQNIAPYHAGRIAAATILRSIESKWPSMAAASEEAVSHKVVGSLLRNRDYRALYDQIIAPGGGWSHTFLDCVSPIEFDKRIAEREVAAKRVAELMEFRLRVFQNHTELSHKAHISAAISFSIKSAAEKKAQRTHWGAWQSLKRSAIFNLVAELFPRSAMRPPQTDDSDRLFRTLHRPAISQRSLRKFFGMYAFACEVLGQNDIGNEIVVKLPRQVFSTKPLSDAELKRAEDYKYDEISELKEDRFTAN